MHFLRVKEKTRCKIFFISFSNISVSLSSSHFQSIKLMKLQWNLSKADTYGTEVFIRFREVSALERFELKSSHI